jgi:hypothetical protein
MRHHFCHSDGCPKNGAHPCHDFACAANRSAAGPPLEPPVRERELEAWHRQLAAIPSVFGRLNYLAGLNNKTAGRYIHPGLKATFGALRADRVIRDSHEQVFREWLSFNLAQQKADLDVFLSSVEGYRRQILAACAAAAPHAWLIPDVAAEHERRLYLADLEVVLDTLYSEYGLTAKIEPATGGGFLEPAPEGGAR